MPDDMDDVEEYMRMLHANKQICVLSYRHRLGRITKDKLDFYADALMEHEIVRKYWARFGGLRADEASGDGRAEEFTAALEKAAQFHIKHQTAAA
ncbi:protein of unknown function [Streptomyces murinus]